MTLRKLVDFSKAKESQFIYEFRIKTLYYLMPVCIYVIVILINNIRNFRIFVLEMRKNSTSTTGTIRNPKPILIQLIERRMFGTHNLDLDRTLVNSKNHSHSSVHV